MKELRDISKHGEPETIESPNAPPLGMHVLFEHDLVQKSKDLNRRCTSRKTKIAITQIVLGNEFLPSLELTIRPIRKALVFIKDDNGAAANPLLQ